MMKAIAVLLACAVTLSSGTIYLHEAFDNLDAWEQSTKKSDYGKFTLSSGAFSGDATINQGMKTSEDAHFYASSRKLDTPFSNDGKDLVVSLSVKHEQGLDCGGGYIKVLPSADPKNFDGESKYFLMFGPDRCGYSKKVHIIFNYKGENLLWKKEPTFPDDKLTHVYTLVVHPDHTYELYIDMEKKESGKLEDDWKFLPPQEIDDPTDKKPADWVEDAAMDDPDDKKPDDWDKEPKEIVDPEAKKPDDWDTEEDGEWEAPMIPNPKYQGEWRPKRIPHPGYKGDWKPKQIPNPAYAPDENLYRTPEPLQAVGIDVWQVKSGSIFDNIIIGDNLDEVNAIVEKTWKATKDAEKAAFDKQEAEAKAAEKKEEPAKDAAADDDEKEEL